MHRLRCKFQRRGHLPVAAVEETVAACKQSRTRRSLLSRRPCSSRSRSMLATTLCERACAPRLTPPPRRSCARECGRSTRCAHAHKPPQASAHARRSSESTSRTSGRSSASSTPTPTCHMCPRLNLRPQRPPLLPSRRWLAASHCQPLELRPRAAKLVAMVWKSATRCMRCLRSTRAWS